MAKGTATAGKVLASHVYNSGSISGIIYDPPRTT